MAAPPPGLENVVLTPPPGLGFPSPKSDDISFASAPILSHDDVKAKRERLEAEKQKNQKEAEKVRITVVSSLLALSQTCVW